MAASSSKSVLAALLLLAASNAAAGPGFLSGADVSRNAFVAGISVRFNCRVEYVSHEPTSRGDRLRIQIDPTAVCDGVSPLAAQTRERYRPAGADRAKLIDLEYDGENPTGQVLILSFSETVGFDVEDPGVSETMVIRVYLDAPAGPAAATPTASVTRNRVRRQEKPGPRYVINLESSLRPPATADLPRLNLAPGHVIFHSEALIDGETWYRTRLGFFDTHEEAAAQLAALKAQYPQAWIDRATVKAPDRSRDASDSDVSKEFAASQSQVNNTAPVLAAITSDAAVDKVQTLMEDARRAMTAGETSRAIQIYTKVRQIPGHAYLPEAQEYLALARERNHQLAHAKAEYERYLALYPEGEGADRVNQRLSALLARSSATTTATAGNIAAPEREPRDNGAWKLHTFFSQYYRRDVNQLNDEEEIISQSSLYSDLNFDARRRGQRFDFSTRLSAGYRSDMLDEPGSPGNETRISYAYADLGDSQFGLRGRLGRQTRHTGGVLGRFDGLNLSYQAAEKTTLNVVAGKPVNSTSDGIDGARTFYGISANYGPIADNLDLGVFYIQQDVEGITDRQAVGGEVRYFDAKRNLWGLVDYDTSYSELGSAFLQASWRFDSKLTISGSFDRRRSPFLSTSNALIGQPFDNFADLAATISEEELRQLSLDRTAISTTYTIGVSYPLTPKLQINTNATRSIIDATAESGGVAATSDTDYRYYSTDIVASSLFREGDVAIAGFRYSESDNARVLSLNLNTRFPFSRRFRINPRVRVDYRQILSDMSYEWTYTPGLRMQYRWGRKMRIEFEGGKQFASRDVIDTEMNRESYFVNLGYQLIF